MRIYYELPATQGERRGDAMAEILGVRSVKRARQAYGCYWCGEIIPASEGYVSWLWVDGGTSFTVRVHPECSLAWSEAAAEEGCTYEAFIGEHERGCRCQRGACRCE